MHRTLLFGMTILLCGASLGAASAEARPGLGSYLQRLLRTETVPSYRAANADLNGDGQSEVVVYLSDPSFCGSGGCNALVLQRLRRGYRVVMRSTITRLPIRRLATRSHGWSDLGVKVGGGGIMILYEAALRFDGHRYPSNPTLAPRVPVAHHAGTILIGETPDPGEPKVR